MALQIVASLIDVARGVIYDRHMFIVQATGLWNFVQHINEMSAQSSSFILNKICSNEYIFKRPNFCCLSNITDKCFNSKSVLIFSLALVVVELSAIL